MNLPFSQRDMQVHNTISFNTPIDTDTDTQNPQKAFDDEPAVFL